MWDTRCYTKFDWLVSNETCWRLYEKFLFMVYWNNAVFILPKRNFWKKYPTKKYKQLTSDIWGKYIKNCFSSWGTWLVLISPNKLFPQTRSPKSHKTGATTMSMTGHHYNIPSTMKIQHLCLNNENTATV